MDQLYHMTQRHLWQEAKASGQPYFPPTYQQDGFIHLTKDPGFLVGIGNHFYREVPGDFLLLVLDPLKLTAKVVFEPAADVGSIRSDGLTGPEEAPLFPHLFGSIDYEAVSQELLMERSPSGQFMGVPGLS